MIWNAYILLKKLKEKKIFSKVDEKNFQYTATLELYKYQIYFHETSSMLKILRLEVDISENIIFFYQNFGV